MFFPNGSRDLMLEPLTKSEALGFMEEEGFGEYFQCVKISSGKQGCAPNCKRSIGEKPEKERRMQWLPRRIGGCCQRVEDHKHSVTGSSSKLHYIFNEWQAAKS
ncbi:hypothetical protein RHMOL_Rhmol02G0093200 [Rhododendron molle]|uniref:Uncharacterized protein n=1 Tax=Rhododendron molle TaxID=49168 RepID=A0ACC0PPJ0_RHOML|nr:hypothetical protein RHMOL_Rhmol02G0093200 [Rhododendron molle]